jgi:hypothetical protein
MKVTINYDLCNYEITLEGEFGPGYEGRYSGRPEDCYEGQAPYFSIEEAYMQLPDFRIAINLEYLSRFQIEDMENLALNQLCGDNDATDYL